MKLIGNVIEFLLVFFYIFCFSLKKGQGIDSSMVVAVFLILYSFKHRNYARMVSRFLFSKYSRTIYTFYIVINIWILIVIIVNGASDYSFALTFLHMFFLVIVGMLVYLFFAYRGTVDKIVFLMVGAFVFQTVIEWCAFLIPQFKELINLTKSEGTIAKGLSYSGVRANGLAGSDFFGLSAAFSVMFMVFLSNKNTWFINNRALKFVLFIFLLSGTFFAGRTGYVGLFVVFLFALFNRGVAFSKKKINSREKFVWVVLIASFFAIISTIVYLYNTNEAIYNLLNFTFQNFFLLLEDGSMKTSSMESLDNMYFGIDLYTFLIGDGQYIAKNGGYYMSTDVGYMRAILYMGVIGLFLLLLMQLSIMKLKKGDEVKLKRYLFLLLLLLNAKGEVIVWNQIVLDTVALFCLQDIFNKQYSLKCKMSYR